MEITNHEAMVFHGPVVKSSSRREDREAFELLLDDSRNCAMAGGNAARPVVFEAMAMSILLVQQKRLLKLEKKLDSTRQENTAVKVRVIYTRIVHVIAKAFTCKNPIAYSFKT